MTVTETDLSADLAALTIDELDARLIRLYRAHLDASKAGDTAAKAEAHRLTMVVIGELGKRGDEWMAGKRG